MPLKIGDRPRQPVGHRAALTDAPLELVELGQRDRALQLGQPVVEGEEVVIRIGIAVAPRLVDEQPHAPGELGIVGDDDAALAGGDVLALLQAEAADGAEGADHLAVFAGEVGLRAVLDYRDAAAAGEFEDRRHLARIAEQMGDDDRLRAVADAGRRWSRR